MRRVVGDPRGEEVHGCGGLFGDPDGAPVARAVAGRNGEVWHGWGCAGRWVEEVAGGSVKEGLGMGKIAAGGGERIDIDGTIAFALIEHGENGSRGCSGVEDGDHDVLNVIVEIKPRLLKGKGLCQRISVPLKGHKGQTDHDCTPQMWLHTITAVPNFPVDTPPTKFSTPTWFAVSHCRGAAP